MRGGRWFTNPGRSQGNGPRKGCLPSSLGDFWLHVIVRNNGLGNSGARGQRRVRARVLARCPAAGFSTCSLFPICLCRCLQRRALFCAEAPYRHAQTQSLPRKNGCQGVCCWLAGSVSKSATQVSLLSLVLA